MKNAYVRWTCGVLAAILVLLAACGAFVYKIDPFFHYRMPTEWKPVYFSERCQMGGAVKHADADTLLMGTSMGANYRESWIEERLGGTAVRVTLPDGYLSEFDAVMDVAFRENAPETVIFSLDANILHRDESGKTDAMPMYVYNDNPVDDVKYLLNKDALYFSFYVLMCNSWGGILPREEAFTWDAGTWWNHMKALEQYKRPDIVAEQTDPADWMADTEANLAVVEQWVTEHPDTEFHIFFPPYSILFWDKTIRLGQTDATFAALERACEVLLQYENVKLYGFLLEPEIVENLDNYCDYVHHSGEVCKDVLDRIAAEKNLLTQENFRETLANWRAHVVNYDYEKFWDDSFWYAWNAQAQSETR